MISNHLCSDHLRTTFFLGTNFTCFSTPPQSPIRSRGYFNSFSLFIVNNCSKDCLLRNCKKMIFFEFELNVFDLIRMFLNRRTKKSALWCFFWLENFNFRFFCFFFQSLRKIMRKLVLLIILIKFTYLYKLYNRIIDLKWCQNVMLIKKSHMKFILIQKIF